MSSIGDNIKKIRVEQGLTQQQLADRCTQLMNNGKKMNGSAIRKYESGLIIPKSEVTQRIARALNVSVGRIDESLSLIDGRTLQYGSAVFVTTKKINDEKECLMIDIDKNKLTADEIAYLLESFENLSKRDGVTITGVSELRKANVNAASELSKSQEGQK